MKQYILHQNTKELVTYLPFDYPIGTILKLKDVSGNWEVVKVGKEDVIDPYLEQDFEPFIRYIQIFRFSEYYLSDELTKKHFSKSL